MPVKEETTDTIHIYQHTQKLIAGSVYWYGEDYPSFSEALDRTLQQVKSAPLKNKLAVHLHLNHGTASPADMEEWKNFYCAEKSQEYRAERALMKRQGFKFLWKCLILLWLCLTGAYAFDQMKMLGDYSQMLGRETFFFLGWVILWKPIEMILFEPWYLKHQLRLIEKLKQTAISTTTL